MAGKRKWAFALALVIALAGFAFFLLRPGAGNQRDSKSRRLPDGTYLSLGGISFQKHNHSFSVKSISGWKRKAASFLPNEVIRRLGWTTSGGSISINGSGVGTNLGFFTICDGPRANGGFVFTRLEVFDEQGNHFEGGGTMGTLGSLSADGKTMSRIDGWGPPAFPRRGKTLTLRFYENKSNKWDQVAEFVIPNPAPGNYPTWTAQPLPITKTNGDLSVTLLNLKSGLSKRDKTKLAASNEVAITQAAFRIMEGGSESNAWRPKQVEISDATGNHWIPYAYLVSTRRENGMDYFSFEGALWPGEAAWKLRFEFSRVADFKPDEVFTFSGIIVPGATQVINLDNTTNVAGSKLQLVAITGTKAKQPGNLKWSTEEGKVNISIRVDPLPKDARLTLLKVTDESGREAEIERGPDWNAPERVYAFKTPEGARQLNFTFALHKSRFVEFMARPEEMRAQLSPGSGVD